MLPAMAWYSDSLDLKLVVPMYLAGLFVCCMFCHGELALLKPAPRYLTTYYLMISLGGALGGLLVGLAAPYLLPGYFELAIGLVACALLLLSRTSRIAWWAVLGLGGGGRRDRVGRGQGGRLPDHDSRVMLRNFYSVVRTRDDTDAGAVPLHGPRRHHPRRPAAGPRAAASSRAATSARPAATAGCSPACPSAPRRVGVIGLGAGSMIAHARAGDMFRFYEINPQVLELARREFTFLADSPATIEVVLGDGRLSLEREPGQQYDVLAMDAFSGDSIPMHLLTREAMAIYLRHLKPGGVLAFQATNRFIDIAPVVASLAAEHGLTAVLISDAPQSTEGADYWLSATDQILVTSDRALLEAEQIRSVGTGAGAAAGVPRLDRRLQQPVAGPEVVIRRRAHPSSDGTRPPAMPPARGGGTHWVTPRWPGAGPAPTPLRPRPGRRRSGAPAPAGRPGARPGGSRRGARRPEGPVRPPAASTRTKAALALAGDLGGLGHLDKRFRVLIGCAPLGSRPARTAPGADPPHSALRPAPIETLVRDRRPTADR